MRTIKIKLSDVRKAIRRGQRYSDDWQASLCEILRIPTIAKRWQQINSRFPAVSINFVHGKPRKGMESADNRAVTDWSQYAGYTFTYGLDGYCWNSVRSEWYSHSASCTWDGVRRETVSQFVNDLYLLALGYGSSERVRLYAAGIEAIEDRVAVAA